jgi:CBS domain-containing membrane protein
MNNLKKSCCPEFGISELDVIAAMKEIQGYIDISPGDFKEVFRIAYAQAMRRVMESSTAKDIMTRPVHCLQADMNLVQAAQFLADKQISGAPVIDDSGRLVGVLSEKDFLARMGLGKPASFMQIVAHCLTNKGCMAMTLRNHSVREIMSSPPISAEANMTMAAISALFMEMQINRLPIIDAEGRPVGIVTRTDLVQSYCLPEGGHS